MDDLERLSVDDLTDEEIEAEQEAEAQEAAEAFEGVEVKSDGNLSPTASHVRRVVEETFRDFLAEGYEVMFAGEPTLWDSDDYRTGANPVFTLPFKDERTREAFFHSTTDEDDYYDSYPAGVEERLNSGYFEWENGFTFEWFDR